MVSSQTPQILVETRTRTRQATSILSGKKDIPHLAEAREKPADRNCLHNDDLVVREDFRLTSAILGRACARVISVAWGFVRPYKSTRA